MYNRLFSVMQSEQHVLYRLMEGGAREAKDDMELTENDCDEWKLMPVDPQERSTWKSGVRFAMLAASQLPGKEPTDAPLPV